MTSRWMLEPIDREKAKEQWNRLMKRRTQIRKLKRKYPTPQYQAKLEVYKLFFQENKEIAKIVVQYLKGLLEENKSEVLTIGYGGKKPVEVDKRGCFGGGGTAPMTLNANPPKPHGGMQKLPANQVIYIPWRSKPRRKRNTPARFIGNYENPHLWFMEVWDRIEREEARTP